MQPSSLSIKKGLDVRFSCHFKSSILTWFFNDGKLPANAVMESYTTVYIKQAESSNNGYYECSYIDKYGYRYYARSQLKVIGRLH